MIMQFHILHLFDGRSHRLTFMNQQCYSNWLHGRWATNDEWAPTEKTIHVITVQHFNNLTVIPALGFIHWTLFCQTRTHSPDTVPKRYRWKKEYIVYRLSHFHIINSCGPINFHSKPKGEKRKWWKMKRLAHLVSCSQLLSFCFFLIFFHRRIYIVRYHDMTRAENERKQEGMNKMCEFYCIENTIRRRNEICVCLWIWVCAVNYKSVG